jgi:23S rRNA (cytosine1962-C5)-methyltransferase
MKTLPRIILKPGREKLLARRHPWIFSGAIERIVGDPGSGDTVEVRDASGVLRARAAFSPQSQIRGRIWTFDADEIVDEAFFRRRLRAAQALRRELVPERASSDPAVDSPLVSWILLLMTLITAAPRWRLPIGRGFLLRA